MTKTKNTRRPRRSAEELLAEHQDKIRALEQRAALEAAQNDPQLAPITEALAEVNKSVANARKGFGTGPQSFDTRITSHQLWINEIEADRAKAKRELDNAEFKRDGLKELLADAVKMLTAGDGLPQDLEMRIANIVEGDDAELIELTLQAEAAKAEREEFNAQKRAPKRKTAEN